MSVFGSKASSSSVYKLYEANVKIGSASAVFLQVDIQFNRNMQPIPTIGSGLHWATLPPQGTMTVGTILTKSGTLVSGLGASGTACKPMSISISTSGTDCNGGGKTITLSGAYCSAITFSMVASQGYVGHGATVMFTEMNA